MSVCSRAFFFVRSQLPVCVYTYICVPFGLCMYICVISLQHAATHCNTLQRTATHCEYGRVCVCSRVFFFVHSQPAPFARSPPAFVCAHRQESLKGEEAELQKRWRTGKCTSRAGLFLDDWVCAKYLMRTYIFHFEYVHYLHFRNILKWTDACKNESPLTYMYARQTRMARFQTHKALSQTYVSHLQYSSADM